MKPVDFTGSNSVLHALDCDDLPTLFHNEKLGDKVVPAHTSVWELNEQEIDAIIQSRKVVLTVLGIKHPPVRVEVYNESFPE